MPTQDSWATERYGNAVVAILPTETALGSAAAALAAKCIAEGIACAGHARIMVGTGNSQRALIASLVEEQAVDWGRVTAFHMDEYVGIDAEHHASFRRWLRTRLAEKCRPAAMHYIKGDDPNIAREVERYGRLLGEAPIDVAFVGFGENGHIAFNDPGVADFYDPSRVKVVTLDERCRQQQVGEGHFPNLAAVPQRAVTVTCSELLAARKWICCVPEARKAEAVRNALRGPIGTACPASVVREHPAAHVYLDPNSAARLRGPD